MRDVDSTVKVVIVAINDNGSESNYENYEDIDNTSRW